MMTTRYLKDWKMLQHYSRRNPPWIKVYKNLLDDPQWHNLDGDAAKALIMIMLIASEDGGRIPDDTHLAFRLRMSTKQLDKIIPQINPWLTYDASSMLALCYQPARPETETESETESERESETESICSKEQDLSIKEGKEERKQGVCRGRTNEWPGDYFERFWAAYPRKVGKLAARRKLDEAWKRDDTSFARLLSAVGAIDTKDPQYIPHPAT
jgi:hypothetical protein